MPDYLYKFVSLVDDSSGENDENEKRFHSLEKDEIWFSVPGKMNDPYEFRGVYVDYDRLKKEGISKSEVDELQHMFEDEYALASFSQGIDSFPMWAHYANDHKGFCVRYRVVDDKRIRKVKYEKQRPDITQGIHEAILTNEKLKDPEMDTKLKGFMMGLQGMFMLVLEQNYTVKHQSWSYEEEYRIIVERTDKESSYGQNVPSNNVGLYVDAIYTGYKCNSYDRLREIAVKLGVPCYRCKLDEKDYMIFAE